MKNFKIVTLFFFLILFSKSLLFSQDSLELYLPFNLEIYDESPNRYEVNSFNVPLVKDRNGIENSSGFFGLDESSRIEIFQEIIDLNDDFTINTWIYKFDSDSYVKYILTNRLNEFGQEAGGADLRVINDTILKFTLRSGNHEEVYNIQYDYLESNKWYFISVVKRDRTLELYLNNVLIGRAKPENEITISNNACWYVGASRNTRGWLRPFSGLIDDVRIFNKALSSQAIGDFYIKESIYLDTTFVTVTDTLLVTVPTNINGLQNELDIIKIYPNPATTEINIDFSNHQNLFGHKYRMTSIDSKFVSEGFINEQHVNINLSEFGGKGLFLFTILSPENHVLLTKKIIIQ